MTQTDGYFDWDILGQDLRPIVKDFPFGVVGLANNLTTEVEKVSPSGVRGDGDEV